MPTTGAGLFRDFLPAPRFCKSFLALQHNLWVAVECSGWGFYPFGFTLNKLETVMNRLRVKMGDIFEGEF